MGVQLKAYDYAALQTRYNERLTHISCRFIGYRSSETVQKTLDRHAMWKTQPPKSPLSGGLVTQFPPDKGGKGG